MYIGYSKYYAILYRELEHLRVLLPADVLEPIPHRYQGIAVFHHICVTLLVNVIFI